MPTDLMQSYRIDPADLPSEAVIFGATAEMREIRRKIDCILTNDLPVLIQGESGTGKEIIARFLHARSNRRDAPFVKVNCSAVPASLLENELFGHEEGSFTGARESRPGLVEVADGGTLFLDEIGDMHLSVQSKLLRLLQDGSYSRIGGCEDRVARMRIICATNVNLQQAVETGSFREDLFYRIEVMSLRLLTLRERIKDIPQLCGYLLEKLARQFRRSVPRLNPSTLHLLQQWDWPGNLRELENWIARAIILGDDQALSAELKRQVALTSGLVGRQIRVRPLKEASRRATTAATRAVILRALQANRWNRRKAAEELKMSYRSLLYKIREAGLPPRRRSHRGLPPSS